MATRRQARTFFGICMAARVVLVQGDLLGSVGEAATAIGNTISEAGAAAGNAVSDSLERSKKQACDEKVQQSIQALNATKWEELEDYCEGIASKVPFLHDQAYGTCWWAGASRNDRAVEEAKQKLQRECMRDESSMSALADWGQSSTSGLTEQAKSRIQSAIHDRIDNDTWTRAQQAGSAIQDTFASTQDSVHQGMSTLGDWRGNVSEMINASMSTMQEWPSASEGTLRHSSHVAGGSQSLTSFRAMALQAKAASIGQTSIDSLPEGLAQPALSISGGVLLITGAMLLALPSLLVNRAFRRGAATANSEDSAVAAALIDASDSDEDLVV